MKNFFYLLLLSLIIISSKCKKTPPLPCPSVECSLDKLPIENGMKYVPGQIVVAYNSKTNISPREVKVILDDIVKEIKSMILVPSSYTTVPPKYTIKNYDNTSGSTGSIIYECLCDANIFIYENDAIIGAETGIVQTGNTVGQDSMRGESPFSLNFIIESDEVIADEIGKKGHKQFEEGFGDNSTGDRIVAFLDSGLRPAYVNSYTDGIYRSNSSEYKCGITDDINGYSFVQHRIGNNIVDDNGHGTLVALAYHNALNKIDENLWTKQRLLPVKVLDECGNGTVFSTACGMRYAVKKGADVINCSWGFNHNINTMETVFLEVPLNVNVVCSAGNKSNKLSIKRNHFPSGYGFNFNKAGSVIPSSGRANIFEISSIKHDIMSICQSSYNPITCSSFSNFRIGPTVTFGEPGEGVGQLVGLNCDMYGTSFSAPVFTAGVLNAINIGIPGVNLKNQIINSRSDMIGSSGLISSANMKSNYLWECKY